VFGKGNDFITTNTQPICILPVVSNIFHTHPLSVYLYNKFLLQSPSEIDVSAALDVARANLGYMNMTFVLTPTGIITLTLGAEIAMMIDSLNQADGRTILDAFREYYTRFTYHQEVSRAQDIKENILFPLCSKIVTGQSEVYDNYISRHLKETARFISSLTLLDFDTNLREMSTTENNPQGPYTQMHAEVTRIITDYNRQGFHFDPANVGLFNYQYFQIENNESYITHGCVDFLICNIYFIY
jgi:hypothetical protein